MNKGLMHEIAEELRGTANSLDTALEERGLNIDSIPSVLLQELDEIVMLCENVAGGMNPVK